MVRSFWARRARLRRQNLTARTPGGMGTNERMVPCHPRISAPVHHDRRVFIYVAARSRCALPELLGCEPLVVLRRLFCSSCIRVKT